MQLDRFLSKHAHYSRKKVLKLLSQQQIKVDGLLVVRRDTPVNKFSHIEISGQAINTFTTAKYFMLHKPAGVLSATIDTVHTTALELLTDIETTDLHIAGRLDRATTGLLILTNDGQWSRKLTELKTPEQQKIPKVYLVETTYAVSPETTQLFAQGIYFAYEDTITSPAQIEVISKHLSRLTIYEGRYHQVKRMFAAVGNRVVNLHRESVGEVVLDPQLTPGQFRPLTAKEVNWIR